MMPKFIMSADGSDGAGDEVFTSVAEFYQHHEGLNEREAEVKANTNRVMLLFKHEMSKTPTFRATLDGRVL